MEQKGKRVQFSEEERRKVRELVLKYRDVVENKKSDAVSVIEKKKAWEKIAEEFNCSTGQHYQRNSSQLKKLWDNLKFKRKQRLGAEKREVMKTGGGPPAEQAPEDQELDSLGNLDIEIGDAVDSDTLALAGTSRTQYLMVNDTLMLVDADAGTVGNGNIEVDAIIEPDEMPQIPQKKGKESGTDDMKVRITRNQQIIDQEKELHRSKMTAEELKNQLLRQQIRNEEELFQLRKTNELSKDELLKSEKELLQLQKNNELSKDELLKSEKELLQLRKNNELSKDELLKSEKLEKE